MESMCVFMLVVLALATATVAARESLMVHDYIRTGQPASCEPMKTPIARKCSAKFGYFLTRVPNFMHHQDQWAASLHFKGFLRLLESQCSEDLAFLLCSYLFPPCSSTDSRLIVTPCRGLCRRVRNACSQTLADHGYTWPSRFQCNALQVKSEDVFIGGAVVACANRPPANTPTVNFAQTCAPQTCEAVPLNKQSFKRGKFDFAIEAEYIESFMVAGPAGDYKALQVKVISSLHSCGTGPFVANATATIHTDANNMCACPDLEHGHRYLFTGYKVANRLEFSTQRSLVTVLTSRKQHRRTIKYMRKFCRPESIDA